MAGTVRLDTDRTAPQHSEARRGSHGIASSLTLSTTPASHLRDGITATGEGGLERIVSPIRNVAPTQATPTYTSIPTFTTTRISASIASMQSGTAHATATRTTLTSTNTHRNDDMEVEEGVDGNSRIWDEMGEFQYESDDEMDEDYDNENVDSNSENSDGSDLSDDILEDEQQSGEKITEKQTALRKKIQLIQADSTVSGPEKAKRIQELMTKQWTAKQEIESSKDTRTINRLTDKKLDFSQISEEDKAVTYHTPSIMGCKHYQRCAKLQAHCCGKWDTCRFCHDEVSDHTIVRSLVVTMMCMFCNLVQPAGQDCVNPACGKRVARYYCKECKLWDDDPRKTIYHCHDCGICRIGKGLGIDYFHCPTCNVCMAIGLKGRHKCIERNLESDCPICGEYMFTSTSTVIFMPCGHCMHHKCHQQYTQTSYQCPTCLKSLADMTDYFRRVDESVALHQMPEEYNSTFSFIYCNDCEKKSYANYHFLYHKCGHCTGYNTKLLQTRIGLPPDAVIASKAIRVAASSLSSLEIAADTALASSTNSGLPNNSATVTRTSSSSAMPNSLATVTRISSASIDISDQHMASQIEELPEESTQATHDTTANVLQSLQSSSSGISSGSRSFWCHHCQLPSELYADGTIFRCTSCSSDFVEEI
ncbi:hypothetical protein BASA81_013181 [Batrachochytrium salamandrivorans]|nr:hypothetical protein BASA81_013181 [Batrachochytrium salamandrivorans]